ncbi:type II toxin-antitoxin system Phd/YefM family antitoxin [Paraburkholderia domus]|uniref:type II toxin-antitoxin system Phd/YefM family antitoxin n=1 Tax=Paraburkholderia domus TaxID=2793075 RepID=UPI001911FEC4|nr:type II toxin-antitoxin system prevent-host-death family antitoxin [Paraburkholderia domus]MBK5065759.1 type II toxin-antitoxin system Phd/YefM family antitoxin [Burkholderia sp. R-70199]CAE6962779.1 Antitoxin YefM [Paraburkholderia domus]
MRTVHFSEARANLKAVIDQVVADADAALIVRRDTPNAVVLSQATYDSLLETIYLLQGPPQVDHLKRAIRQVSHGELRLVPMPSRESDN